MDPSIPSISGRSADEVALLVKACDFFSHPLALVDSMGRLIIANSVWHKIFNVNHASDKGNSKVQLLNDWDRLSKEKNSDQVIDQQVEADGRIFDIYLNSGCGVAQDFIWVIYRQNYGVKKDLQTERIAHEERLSAMAEMAAGIAHEILNPLTIIAGKTSQLSALVLKIEHGLKPDLIKCTQSIFLQCNRITRIVRAMRTFSRNESQDEMHGVSLRQMIEEAIALCSEKSRLKGTVFSIGELPTSLNVKCRAVQIVQILVNLFSNAIDATENVEMPEVTVQIRRAEGMVEILVCDNGPGVPEAVATKIFQPFFTTKGVGKGTGLGLSLSAKLSRENEGDLYFLRSVSNSCFVLKLKEVCNDSKNSS